MRPHPHFRDAEIPREHALGDFVLKAVTIDDLDRDYEAVMESASDIKAANPSLTWPTGLTRRDNLIDLAWHQREFQACRSFAWIIEDQESRYLGCLYVYPSIAGEDSADVHWWWRTGAKVDKAAFRERLLDWLNGPDWLALEYKLGLG